MKDRLPGLDGLRGLAALGVVLAHINFQPQLISTAPILIESYRSLAVGPNSVQILFVLCGFLMALLYPVIPNKLAFIQKRYTRIFPVFSVIVAYLWLTSLENIVPIIAQPLLLLIIALVFFGGWKLLRKIDSTGRLGRYVFYSFLALQIIMVGLSLTILPKIILFQTISVPPIVQNILIALSNLTLTTPLVLGLKRLSLVFWSLAPEVLFYLLYPVIVIPLIKTGRKIGILGSIVMIGIITKILFDLELATISIGALQSMSIARASGFVAGVTIGSIYQSRGAIWQKIEGVGSKKFISILIILSFIFIQWGDGAVRDGQSMQFMNLYYLLSSWVFAAVIAIAIIPNTIVYKILKNKFFIFLGVISYSMYLIHTEVVGWIDQVFLHFTIYRDGQVIPSSIHLFLSLGATFIVSFILFHIVEKRYFDGKKNGIKSKKAIHSNSSTSNKITYSFVAFLLLLSITIYAGAYPLSFSLSRQSFPTDVHKNTSLLDGPVRIPLYSHEAQLSLITAHMTYSKNAGNTKRFMNPPASLTFKLFDEKGSVIASSAAIAYEVEGAANFPFGITPLPDSKNKSYVIEYSLSHGSIDDQVILDTSSTSLVAAYTHPETKTPRVILAILMNRILFALTNPSAIFLLATILLSAYFWRKSK